MCQISTTQIFTQGMIALYDPKLPIEQCKAAGIPTRHPCLVLSANRSPEDPHLNVMIITTDPGIAGYELVIAHPKWKYDRAAVVNPACIYPIYQSRISEVYGFAPPEFVRKCLDAYAWHIGLSTVIPDYIDPKHFAVTIHHMGTKMREAPTDVMLSDFNGRFTDVRIKKKSASEVRKELEGGAEMVDAYKYDTISTLPPAPKQAAPGIPVGSGNEYDILVPPEGVIEGFAKREDTTKPANRRTSTSHDADTVELKRDCPRNVTEKRIAAIRVFVETECDTGPDYYVRVEDFYTAYNAFVERNHLKVGPTPTQTMFTKAALAANIPDLRRVARRSMAFMQGIRIKDVPLMPSTKTVGADGKPLNITEIRIVYMKEWMASELVNDPDSGETSAELTIHFNAWMKRCHPEIGIEDCAPHGWALAAKAIPELNNLVRHPYGKHRLMLGIRLKDDSGEVGKRYRKWVARNKRVSAGLPLKTTGILTARMDDTPAGELRKASIFGNCTECRSSYEGETAELPIPKYSKEFIASLGSPSSSENHRGVVKKGWKLPMGFKFSVSINQVGNIIVNTDLTSTVRFTSEPHRQRVMTHGGLTINREMAMSRVHLATMTAMNWEKKPMSSAEFSATCKLTDEDKFLIFSGRIGKAHIVKVFSEEKVDGQVIIDYVMHEAYHLMNDEESYKVLVREARNFVNRKIGASGTAMYFMRISNMEAICKTERIDFAKWKTRMEEIGYDIYRDTITGMCYVD